VVNKSGKASNDPILKYPVVTQIHLIPGGLLGDVGSSCLRKPAADRADLCGSKISMLDTIHGSFQKMKEH
jgi:hypothetical protein